MTPEFDRRSAIVLGSPYWQQFAESGTHDQYMGRIEDFRKLQDAIQAADKYEDLSKPLQAIYDEAEKVAKKDIQDFKNFAAQDDQGFGRFHEAIEGSYGELVGTDEYEDYERTE